MTYLPITPDTGTVHFFANPGRASDTRTVCGASGEWVKSVAAIDGSEPICATCYPDSATTAPTTNQEDTTMPATTDYSPYVCTDVVCQARKDAGQRCPWCWGGYPKSWPLQPAAATNAHQEDNMATWHAPEGCTCTSPEMWVTCPSDADHI